MALVELQTSNALDLLFSAAPTNIVAPDGALPANAAVPAATAPAALSFAELMAQASVPMPGTLTAVVQPVEIVTASTVTASTVTTSTVAEQNIRPLKSAASDPETIDSIHSDPVNLFLATAIAVDPKTDAAAVETTGRVRTATNHETDIAQLEQLLPFTAEPSSTADSLQTLTVFVTPPEQSPAVPETLSDTQVSAGTTPEHKRRAAAEIPPTSPLQFPTGKDSFAVAPQQTDAAITDSDAASTTGLAATNVSAAANVSATTNVAADDLVSADNHVSATGGTTIDADTAPPASGQKPPRIRLFDPAAAAHVPASSDVDDVPMVNETTSTNVLTSPTTAADILTPTVNRDATSQPAFTQQPPVMAVAPTRPNGSVKSPEFGTTTASPASVTSGSGNIAASQGFVADPDSPPVSSVNSGDNNGIAATVEASKPGSPANDLASVRMAPETAFQNETSDPAQQSLNSSANDVDASAELSDKSTRLPGNANRGLHHQAAVVQNSSQQFWASPGPMAAMSQGIPGTAAGLAARADVGSTEPAAATATLNKGAMVPENMPLGVVGNDVSVNANLLPSATSTHPVNVLDQLSTEVMQRAESLGQDAEQRFTIRLDPPELGKLVISMKRTVHGIEMHVDAADPVTLNLIQSGLDQLDSDANDAQSVFRQLNIDVTTGDGSGRSAHDRRPAFAGTPSRPTKMEDEAVEQALPDRISFVA